MSAADDDDAFLLYSFFLFICIYLFFYYLFFFFPLLFLFLKVEIDIFSFVLPSDQTEGRFVITYVSISATSLLCFLIISMFSAFDLFWPLLCRFSLRYILAVVSFRPPIRAYVFIWRRSPIQIWYRVPRLLASAAATCFVFNITSSSLFSSSSL